LSVSKCDARIGVINSSRRVVVQPDVLVNFIDGEVVLLDLKSE
jgi:hypothetical protein